MREIIAVADRANQFIDDKKPGSWQRKRTRTRSSRRLFRGHQLFSRTNDLLEASTACYGREERGVFGSSLDWTELNAPLEGHTINNFSPLIQRIDPDAVAAMVEAVKRKTIFTHCQIASIFLTIGTDE